MGPYSSHREASESMNRYVASCRRQSEMSFTWPRWLHVRHWARRVNETQTVATQTAPGADSLIAQAPHRSRTIRVRSGGSATRSRILRGMRKFLLITLVAVSLPSSASCGGCWPMRTATNRQLVELIQQRTGLSVAIRGDLKWRLWPPVQLVAQDVTADWAATAPEPMLAARALSLDADVVAAVVEESEARRFRALRSTACARSSSNTANRANWMPPGHAGAAVPPLPIPPPASQPQRRRPIDPPWEIASICAERRRDRLRRRRQSRRRSPSTRCR